MPKEVLKNLITSAGGKIVNSIPQCNYCISDGEGRQVMLNNQNKPVLDSKWIFDALEKGKLPPKKNYLVRHEIVQTLDAKKRKPTKKFVESSEDEDEEGKKSEGGVETEDQDYDPEAEENQGATEDQSSSTTTTTTTSKTNNTSGKSTKQQQESSLQNSSSLLESSAPKDSSISTNQTTPSLQMSEASEAKDSSYFDQSEDLYSSNNAISKTKEDKSSTKSEDKSMNDASEKELIDDDEDHFD
eukprot:TRINITY_DN4506_c2_g1_i1.p1 TRINITY_DN4506_c2_g1~~TRINITY_DN4506_c2_g1_i1.p1  ORF type:complete len:243 (+),score=102.82 TRINITY_DN4506_c2_g1_i1:316-1044(+)